MEARAAIMAGMQERFCEVIEDNAAIRWEEAGEEFSMNGDWYDVVAIKKVEGKTLLYCMNDKREAQLVNTFASLMASSSSQGKNSHAIIKFHVTDQYILIAAPVPACIPAANYYHINLTPSLLCTYADSLVPPPRC